MSFYFWFLYFIFSTYSLRSTSYQHHYIIFFVDTWMPWRFNWRLAQIWSIFFIYLFNFKCWSKRSYSFFILNKIINYIIWCRWTHMFWVMRNIIFMKIYNFALNDFRFNTAILQYETNITFPLSYFLAYFGLLLKNSLISSSYFSRKLTLSLLLEGILFLIS